MYLRQLEDGHAFVARQLLHFARRALPRVPLDVVKVLMYRPGYFGGPFCRAAHVLMRAPDDMIGWTIGERELLGAFTSRLNHCVF